MNLLYSKEEEIFDKCYQYEPSREALRREFSHDLLLKYNENLLSKETGLVAMLENHQV